MLMPGRAYSAQSSYRYGFNGKENDNEVKGEGHELDFGNRAYDPRIGTWLSTDRVKKSSSSPYQYSASNPINFVDPSGNDEIHFHYFTLRVPTEVITRTENGGVTVTKTTILQTYRWVEVIKDNNKDRFFVHKDAPGINGNGVEFYPNSGERTKSGITSTYYLFNTIKLPDTDNESLQKLANEFPELRDVVLPTIIQSPEQAKAKTVQNQNRSWWSNFYASLRFKNQQEAEKAGVDKMMLGIITALATEGASELFISKVLISVKNASVGTRVLGSYPQYLELAEKIGAKRFSVPDAVWNAMSEEQRWAANVKFLDRGIANGDRFILSNSAFEAKKGTQFYKELQYMYKRGYKASEDGMSLIKK